MDYLYIGIITIGVALAVTATLLVRKANRNLQRRLLDAFGKAPGDTDYDIDSIDGYHHYMSAQDDTNKNIDSTTWNDLDMDLVYKRINGCQTSVGEEYLYHALHEPQFEQSTLDKRERLMRLLDGDKAQRLRLQCHMEKLGKSRYSDVSSLVHHAGAKRLKRPWLYSVLAVLPLLCVGVMAVNATVGLVCVAASVLANGLVFYFLRMWMEKDLPAVQYFAAMLYCCKKIVHTAHPELKAHLNEMKEAYTAFSSLRSYTPYSVQKGSSDIAFMADFVRMIFLTDIRKYNRIIERILQHPDPFHRLYRALGELDMAVCVLSYRRSLPAFCRPSFHEHSSITFDGIYHPLIKKPIVNSGVIDTNSLVTGPNASGKSTFIKALAVNCILAQTINTCAAAAFSIRFFLVMTSMAVKDSIAEGESYFITEIKSLKRIVDKAQNIPCVCFIDEILRGTNTIERIAASSALLRYLCGLNCLCVAATHDIELTEIMKKQYDNYHFSEKISADGVVFDFLLRQGAAKTSNAIKLLDAMGFDESIVHNARQRVNKYLADKKW